MIRICTACLSTWAGGTACADCGGRLADPFSDEAQEFPDEVWRYIRLQYGARRGMLVRVMAFLLGPVVAVVLARQAVLLSSGWRGAGLVGALAAGFLVWLALYHGAGKAVRVWVLRKGQVRKGRLARALLRRYLTPERGERGDRVGRARSRTSV